jgi:hypothetical protein
MHFRKWTGSLSRLNFSNWNWMGMLAEIMGQLLPFVVIACILLQELEFEIYCQAFHVVL